MGVQSVTDLTLRRAGALQEVLARSQTKQDPNRVFCDRNPREECERVSDQGLWERTQVTLYLKPPSPSKAACGCTGSGTDL